MPTDNNKLELLKLTFKKAINDAEAALKENVFNDCNLFLNLYKNLQQACIEYDNLNIESLILKISFNETFKSRMDDLKALEESLRARQII